MPFNLRDITAQVNRPPRYERRLQLLKAQGKHTASIESAVTDAMRSLAEGHRKAFVIYGEPQSGKTEMMIALTAKLLDSGLRVIVVLLNDSVQLLNQNLSRFRGSGLDPAPCSFSEILDASVDVREGEWVVFCKKNARDLQKLTDKLAKLKGNVVIDDEADYATPNAKINQGQQTRINELVGKLLKDDGTYIGVTATPARLDLNRTFENEPEHWVDFPPHPEYKGQDFFFPGDIVDIENLKYRLTLLPDAQDLSTHLRGAVFGYLLAVGYLNIKENDVEQCYSMLVHTSGARADHTEDYKQVIELINVLKNPGHRKFEKYAKQMWEMAEERYRGSENQLVAYVLQNINRSVVIVMNSDFDRRNQDYETATEPSTLFTFAIGGNIVSRGVTFNRLLSMFFTRDARHRIQQDTYIQRARMFGVRAYDMRQFELTIPEALYGDWHRCFVFHRLALETIRAGNESPVWLGDRRISTAAGSSIHRARLDMNAGEMSFGQFKHTAQIESVLLDAADPIARLRSVQQLVGSAALPDVLIRFIERFSPHGQASTAIHESKSIMNYDDADVEAISRTKGLIGKSDREERRFPQALHHIKVFFNDKGAARLFYRYQGSISFMKMMRPRT
jgi:hypothetical protein